MSAGELEKWARTLQGYNGKRRRTGMRTKGGIGEKTRKKTEGEGVVERKETGKGGEISKTKKKYASNKR